MNNLNIIIPAAGLGRRMKTYGPKPLINIGDTNLISRQLNILEKKYPEASISIVLGYDSDKVIKYLECHHHKNNIKLIVNDKYLTTNVAKSISLAYEKTNKTENYLIVYGDLIFNANTFDSLNFNESGVLLDTNNQFSSNEVGTEIENGQVVNFAYRHSQKWAQIFYLKSKDMILFDAIVNKFPNDKFFSYEIMNIMVNKYRIKLKAYQNNEMSVKELDFSDDIDEARKLEKEGKF